MVDNETFVRRSQLKASDEVANQATIELGKIPFQGIVYFIHVSIHTKLRFNHSIRNDGGRSENA